MNLLQCKRDLASSQRPLKINIHNGCTIIIW